MKKIGIALGSGSARGWAHIGVLNALQQLGIQIDVVAGCSIGSLVGAAFACGKLTELEEWVKRLKLKEISKLIDLNLSGGGVISGSKLVKFFEDFELNKDIDDLAIDYGSVATDIYTGREVWLKQGPLIPAIRASISLPGFFKPVNYNNTWLVDGGLVNPVPISLCRALGADIVIAVDLNNDLLYQNKPEIQNKTLTSKLSNQLDKLYRKITGSSKEEPSYFDVMGNSIKIMQDRITRSRAAGDLADFTLQPRLGYLSMYDFDQAKIAILEGESCVKRVDFSSIL